MFLKEKQKLISFVLIFTMVFSIVMIPPKKAVAQGGLAACAVAGVASLVAAAVQGSMVPVNDFVSNMKDQCLDGLFFVLNEVVLKKITADTVNWINSGFDGNPAFVEDYDKLLTDVADAEIGAFLESSELAFLCSPFQLEIKKALIRQNKRGSGGAFEKNISCRLSEVSDNIENFIEGDFSDGGWDAWRALSEDNPYSNYMKVSLELQSRALGKVEAKKEVVSFGNGFLSYEDCTPTGESVPVTDLGDAINNGSFEAVEGAEDQQKLVVEDCKTVTPGAVINEQLNNVLPAGLRRLEAADEMNEIVDALLAHYLNEVLSKGLKNMSKKDDNGKSYNDKVNDSATTTSSNGN